MATAKDVKTILQETIYGVENVKLVNDNVKAVDDRVKSMADGVQRLFSESPASSLDDHYPDRKETAKELTVILQQTADGVDDVKRS